MHGIDMFAIELILFWAGKIAILLKKIWKKEKSTHLNVSNHASNGAREKNVRERRGNLNMVQSCKDTQTPWIIWSSKSSVRVCLDLCVCDAILQMQMNEIRKMSVDRKRMPNECEYMMRQNGSKWGRTETNQSGLGVFTKGERENIGFICVTISYRIAFVRHTFLICLMVINLGFMPTNTHTKYFLYKFRIFIRWNLRTDLH